MPRRILSALFVLLGTSLCAFGDIAATDWTIKSSGGNYSWAGGSASLTGISIPITKVQGIATPTNDLATEAIIGLCGGNGCLSFKSGPYNGIPGATWSWSGGAPATLSLTGCVSGVTGTGPGHTCQASDYSAVLVSDDFTGVSITQITPKTRDLVFGNLTGTINSKVAAFYGVSTAFFPTNSTADDFISINATQGNKFSNAHSIVPGGLLHLTVPEDWSLSSTFGLFAFALAIFGIACRRGLLKVSVP